MKKFFKIAEVGQAHDGSLGILHSFIDALSGCGVDAIKFQTHFAEAESSKYEPFRVEFSYEDKSRYDYWKRMSFEPGQWKEIAQHCAECNLEFMSSPFSLKAVEVLEDVGIKRYKIGSGEITNHLLLETVAKTGKQVILSSGLSSFEELDSAIQIFQGYNNDISILQCTTSYPTQPDQWGLNLISEIKERYNLPTGFSDHSGDIFACLSAANWGAEIFEFHVTFDQRMFGPDSRSSLTLEKVKELTKGLDQISMALSNPQDKRIREDVAGLKSIFEKSLAVNKNLSRGDIITIEDLETKKPANKGIPARDFRSVIGLELKEDLSKWDFLNWESLLKK